VGVGASLWPRTARPSQDEETAMDRHDLTDAEWAVIQPLPPTKVRGVPRVDDRRVIHGILWRFRAGTPWRDVPVRYGPRTTLYNRFVRWRAAGIWDRILDAVSEPYDGDIVMIDSSRARSRRRQRKPRVGRAGRERGSSPTVGAPRSKAGVPDRQAGVAGPRHLVLRMAFRPCWCGIRRLDRPKLCRDQDPSPRRHAKSTIRTVGSEDSPWETPPTSLGDQVQ
jgi:transposase